tara:strand:+ start:655 stop:1449 length:795 start_codon:yes stop_codon:yes gene_type:complete
MAISPGTSKRIQKENAIGSVRSITNNPCVSIESGRSATNYYSYVITNTAGESEIHDDDYVVLKGHGLSIGDPLVYNSQAVGTTASGADVNEGLVETTSSGIPAPYKRSTSFNKNQVNIYDNSIRYYTDQEHKLKTGDRLSYEDGSGTAIGGLTNGHVYWVIKKDENNIQLATSKANAEHGTAIDLTTVGTTDDQNWFYVYPDGFTFYVSIKSADHLYLFRTRDEALADTDGNGTGDGVVKATFHNTQGDNNDVQTFACPFGTSK